MTIDDIAVHDYLWVDDPAGGRTIMVQVHPGEWVGPRDLTSDHQGILDGRPELVTRPAPAPDLPRCPIPRGDRPMTTFTPEDHARLRDLADKATPGPWETFKTKRGRDNGIGSASPTVPSDEAVMEDVWSDPADAAFIVAARNALPALLDALDAETLRADRAEARVRVWQELAGGWREQAKDAEARIQAVREMHGPWEEPGHRVCRVCIAPAEWEETYRAPYPCPTVRALDGEDA